MSWKTQRFNGLRETKPLLLLGIHVAEAEQKGAVKVCSELSDLAEFSSFVIKL